jgi:hypothetical protein
MKRLATILALLVLVLGTAVSCNSPDTKPAGARETPKAELKVPPAKPAPAAPPENAVVSAKWKGGAELLGIGLGLDGGLIALRFRMKPQEARLLRQGQVYVIDETTRRAYREVPVMPKLGPLISRPKQAGQVGYAMLVNAPAPLKSGALVTVVLGNHRQEHVLVQ